MARSVSSGAAPPCATIAELLHVLGRAEAFDLLRLLANGPVRTGELAAALELEYSAISGKLRPLRAAGLVAYRQIKKYHFYELTSLVHVELQDETIQVSIELSSNQHMTIVSPPIVSNTECAA